MAVITQRGENEKKPDMAQYFLDEHQSLDGSMSLRDRDLYLAGTAITAVVAGRFVPYRIPTASHMNHEICLLLG